MEKNKNFNKIFSCNFCINKYSTKSSLCNHNRIYHKNKNSQNVNNVNENVNNVNENVNIVNENMNIVNVNESLVIKKKKIFLYKMQ
jgi:hypothetical protein